jgi:anaerobic selenocysteine-containing dehydrogenase
MTFSLADTLKLSRLARRLLGEAPAAAPADRSAPERPGRAAAAAPAQTAPQPLPPPAARAANGELAAFPPPERWDDWVEHDPRAWPRRKARRYMLVPTTCFNCESACGLLAYVDRESLRIQKFEGNPTHPGSRGRTCAKGPATLNQVYDPDRILYPLKRVGPRGGGRWERTTWDEVLDTFAARIRRALAEGRRTEVMYHVGRPGEDGYMERVLWSWGVDGHNSHTNICSSAGRVGYALWMGLDRPSPDHANARFILLISAHLESGHYFNPHAQRVMEAKMRGAKLAVMDPRLSNSASHADYWLPTYPGSETVVLLAMASVIIRERLYDREFVRRWTNWDEFMREERPHLPRTFEAFEAELATLYAEYTPERAARESGVAAETVVEVAREIGRAGAAFSSHNWRAAAAGNYGGWQVARALFFLNVLTGSVGTVGGTSANAWDKFVPRPFAEPPRPKVWNELTWPKEYPLAFHEMSFLLPHFLKEGRGKVDVYFTRVYNPVWTNPDGFTWMEVLKDGSKVGLHAAMTPVWSETAWFADYVLPMGVGAERHDTHSYETHAAQWLGFRQPVVRVAMEKLGRKVEFTYQANPGEVWEENEFWIELSWRIDPDGGLGIRRLYESPYRPGQKVTVEEYYGWMFEHAVPGLPEAAAKEGLTPLAYMRKYGAFEVRQNVYRPYEETPPAAALEGAHVDPVTGVVRSRAELPHSPNAVPLPAVPADEHGTPVGVVVDGAPKAGFPTPSRKLEFYSRTLKEWRWPEYAIPGHVKSHVHPDEMDRARGDFVLVPTFRLPTLIHTRSGNAKWLYEISHSNPLWMNPADAERLGFATDDLVKVRTEIGHFVARVWVTEGIRPGVVACSHHMGRWRLAPEAGGDRWSTGLADLSREDGGPWRLRIVEGISPFASDDPDSGRVWWTDAGVHQNLAFPVHPDPVSGAHSWHQKVRLDKPGPGDRYGDVQVDTVKAHEVYRRWLALARPAPGPGGLRRPLWFLRPYRPDPSAYRMEPT